IAAGGGAAPLAAYGDYLLFTEDALHRMLLTIGGISNYTFLPTSKSARNAFATDLGPGKTIMNQNVHKHCEIEMDRDAAIAYQGTVNPTLLKALLEEHFLSLDFPKTTGPELFNLAYLEA